MKKCIYMLAALFAVSACNLDKYPYSEIAADNYVKDEASVNNLVIGAYNALHGVMYYEWAMTELRSDNSRMRVNNSTSADSKLIEQLDQGTILTAHAWVQDYWDKTYAAIYRVNNVLSNLGVVADPQRKSQFEGEARFLRAHLYFNLVRLWGPVFLVDKKPSPAEARTMQRSTEAEIYELIESDLQAVVDGELLPVTMTSSELGRADLKAAKALLAKVYMTHYKVGSEKYEAARTLLSEVIELCGAPASGAALVSYDRIFSPDNEMNAEIIFAVRYLSGNQGLGCPFSTLFGPLNNGGNVVVGAPKHYNYPSDNLIAAYAANPGDKRKDVVLQESYWNATTSTIVNDRFCNKFIQTSMTTEYDAENDWPVIRLGDVILLYAEIVNELSGPTGEALKYLNMIRERAGVPVYADGELASKYAFRQAVRNERRLELAMENQRFFDLLRWNTATSVINDYLANEAFYSGYDYKVNPISDWQTRLPIPMTVISINNKIAQNPGY